MSPPDPVKLYVAVLYPDPSWLERGVEALVRQFGPLDLRGTSVPFDHTAYYEAEMGSGLQRILISLERLIAPEAIIEAKLAARDFESEFSEQGRRRVNLDVGYVDTFKVTLASFKGRGNKVYLGQEVWLDVQLYFERGKLHPLPWTFPDFRAGRYGQDLLAIRKRYCEQLRQRPFGAATEVP